MQYIRKLSFVIVSFFCLSTIGSLIATSDQPQPEQPAQESLQSQLQDVLEPLRRQAEQVLAGLEGVLQGLVLDINNGILKTADIKSLKDRISTHRKIIQQWRTTLIAMTAIDPMKLLKIMDLTKQFIEHLNPVIKNRLKNFPIFTGKTVRTRTDDLTFEDLENAAHDNTASLKAIKNKANRITLRWHNRAYRKIHTLWNNCNLGSVSKLTLACAALGSYLLFKSESTHAGFRNIFGWARDYHERIFARARDFGVYENLTREKLTTLSNDQLRLKISHDYPIGKIGSFDSYIMDFNLGKLPVATWIVSPYLLSQTKHYWHKLSKFVSEKSEKLSNALKGGVHAQQVLQESNNFEINPRYTFDDVIGYENIKADLRLRILKFIEDPERFIRQGLTPEKGWLFTGPTRTGKSFMFEALCGEIKQMMEQRGEPNKVKYFTFSASQIQTLGINVIVNHMKQYAPCVVFIDEIDLLNLQRHSNSPLLGEFLTTMSGCMADEHPDKVVVLVGATNKPETLDKSLRQHGRFGKEIRFETPSLLDRKKYIEERFSKLAIDTSQLDIDSLAYETYGHVYEDIEAMITEALKKAIQKGLVIDQQLLEKALNTEARRMVYTNDQRISPEEQEIIAIHLMGSAMAHFLQGSPEIVSIATIRPIVTRLMEESQTQDLYRSEEYRQKETIYGDVFTFRADDFSGVESMQDRIIRCKILLAGNIAEKIIRGSSSFSYRSENKYRAFQIAKEITCEGIHPSQLSDEIKDRLTNKAWELIKEYENELTQLFEKQKSHLMLLSTLLLLEKDVKGIQIAQILKLPEEEVLKIWDKFNTNPDSDSGDKADVESKQDAESQANNSE